VNVDYLVTGGAGFIGCSLAAELLAARLGGRIVAVDSLHPQIHPDMARPAALPAQVDLRVMDVCDAEAWRTLLAEIRPGVIVHLAAETGTGQSLDLPARHTHVNVTGTAVMLEAVNEAQIIPAHILLASSRAVYGEGRWRDPADGHSFLPEQRTPEQLRQREFDFAAPSGQIAQPLPQDQRDTPPRPTSVYGATKLAQEHVLAAWCTARSVPLSVLRLQNVYGVGQSPYNSYTGILGLFHRVAAGGGAIEVYEDGQIGRDFIYIDDVTRSMAAALGDPPARSRTVDVGSSVVTTVLDAARLIAGLHGAPEPVISGAFRPGDVRWAVCSPQGLKDELGVEPGVGFMEGNRRLSEWLREIGIIG
jgi:dTDP-L-rhamnose 4-epimerase